MEEKILYLKGRPNAHTLHRRLAESLGCSVDFIDAKARWQDCNKSFFFNLISWIKNARYFAQKYANYDVFLIDNLHFTPIIMKFFLLGKKKKMIVHLGSHTLFFIHKKKFSKINLWLHKKILRKYDALICEGQMAKQFAENILKNNLPPTYVTFLGPPSERLTALNSINPNLESYKIIIVANGPTHFRLYYKGLDLMIKSFARAQLQLPQLTLSILGDWSEVIVQQLLASVHTDTAQRILFVGNVSNIEMYFSNASLCLHCTRGDAFPTSTLEAMTAGIPVILSEWTGTKEAVGQVDPKLIVTMDERAIADRIVWYYNLSSQDKSDLSIKCKEVAKNYTEEKAIKHYQKTFEQIFADLEFNK